jgi:multiple sugar transport system substrate-binding protein
MKRWAIVFMFAALVLFGLQQTAFSEGKKEAPPAQQMKPSSAEIVTGGLPFPLPQYPTKQEKEAILAARRIASQDAGQVTLRVLISPDNVSDFEPFYPEWLRETGVKIETRTVPWPDWFKELMNVSITKTDAYDVFMMAPQWVPDLAEARVIESFTPFINKYKPETTDPASPNRVLPGLESYGKYKGNYYLLFSDTDVATLYLRKDWLADPENQRNFKAKYGYALDKPKTVEEWRDQLEFFNNPGKDVYGMAMSWGDETAFDFYSRFLSQKVAFFDKDMHPLINSPQAVKALQEMKANLQFAMPGILEFDSVRALEAFASGKVYCTLIMTWAQAAFEDPKISKVVGKVTYAPHPGRMIGGELVSPQPQYWGWGYSVSAYSKHKELAYLYSQWMNGAAMNARIAFTPGGWYDVNKASTYDEKQFPQIRRKNGGIYMDEWMDNQKWQVEHCFPAITMRGGEEYSGVLLEAVSGVLKGALEPQAALDAVAKKWEEITDRYGRQGQIESWNSLKAMYSPAVRKWLGF